ncbi:hypothetical protein YTPLAS18_26250 [Nitrospira sp.]|nr:hypothetical protein YTPLAS18_26250 [Nitrospira sp.]
MTVEISEKTAGRVDGQGLLFEYTIKLTLIAALLELILYRLTSRLGMHFSKVAQEHEWVRLFFYGLSSIGFMLLNVVALLVFLALGLLVFRALRGHVASWTERVLWPMIALLLVLTVAFVVLVIMQVDLGMMSAVAYNLVAFIVLTCLVVHYVVSHASWLQRMFALSFYLGLGCWIYYQSLSTIYGAMGIPAAPLFVHEANRIGEALMVLASLLTFVAFGTEAFFSRNRRQRRRVVWFIAVGAAIFTALLFVDYFLGLYDSEVAYRVRKGGEGISWIFQMGMGYTFYLPFVLYMTGLLCWSYTVIRLVNMGRLAGYGIGLMFAAGYALQLSHLTLMVVLGMLLLGLDKLRLPMSATESSNAPLVGSGEHLLGERV